MSEINPYNEEGILQKVAEGDEAAFRELFHRYADLLGTFVFRLTRSWVFTEEIVQDVFLKIWLNREALVNVNNFKVFLFVISRNQTLNAMRTAVRQMSHQKKWEAQQVMVLQADQCTVEDQDNDRLLGLIDQAIGQLPPQQKTAWLLSRQEGLTHSQIATNMGLSKETVKKYIMYANESLKRYMSASTLLLFVNVFKSIFFF